MAPLSQEMQGLFLCFQGTVPIYVDFSSCQVSIFPLPYAASSVCSQRGLIFLLFRPKEKEMTALDMLASRLREHMEALACSPRVPGSRQHRFAQNYVADWLKYAGCTVWRERFCEVGSGGYNVMGRVPSQRKCAPIFIIGAHYDSTAESPAAADAGGLAVMLELASTLTPQLRHSEKCHVQFAAYGRGASAVVAGYGGCRAHAREVFAGKWIARCALLMGAMGYDDFVELLARSRDSVLLRKIEQGLRSAGLPQTLSVIREMAPASSVRAFWDYAMPAVAVTNTAEIRNLHRQVAETSNTLNYTFLAKVTRGLAAAIRDIAGVKIPEKEVRAMVKK